MAHEACATALPCRLIGYAALGFAAFVTVVPASLAQNSEARDPGRFPGNGITAELPQAPDVLPGGVKAAAPDHAGVSVAVPVGKVSVGYESVENEPRYERRTTVREGMTIVEFSTTPFMPDTGFGQENSNSGQGLGNPAALPASW